MKNVQRWRCATCGYEYTPALPASQVLCPNHHLAPRGPGGRGLMELIEGELPKERRKKVPSGN